MRPIYVTLAAVAACALMALTTGRGAPEHAPAAAADGPAPATRPATRPATVTRTYDIRELLVDYPDFTAPDFSNAPLVTPATNPSGNVPGLFNRVDARGETLMSYEDMQKDVADFIAESVDPDSWKDVGGDVGSMHIRRGGLLVVTHTPDAQARVKALLDDLVAGHGHTVRVRAEWVQGRRRDFEPALRPAGGKPGAALLEVDPAALDKLAEGTIHYRGEVVCMNHQRVFVTSALLQPLAAGDGADASPSVLSTGLSLDVTPNLNADGKSATVTLRMQATPTAPPARPAPATRPATRPAGGDAAAHGPVSSDAVVYAMQFLSTTARVPLGRMVLVGGMSLGAAADPGRDPDPPQVYLFVEVTAD